MNLKSLSLARTEDKDIHRQQNLHHGFNAHMYSIRKQIVQGIHGFYIRFYIRCFDLLKAFGYIERVLKSEFFSERPNLHHISCATCSALPAYISTMLELSSRF